jgi:hypothetical protein
MTTTGKASMEKQEAARNVVKRGADMLRMLRQAEQIDDAPSWEGNPIIETTADGLNAASILLGEALDAYSMKPANA